MILPQLQKIMSAPSLFSDPTLNAAKDRIMNKEEQAIQAAYGEVHFMSQLPDNQLVVDEKSEEHPDVQKNKQLLSQQHKARVENLVRLEALLRSGMHPRSLHPLETELLEVLRGKDWYLAYGYNVSDVSDGSAVPTVQPVKTSGMRDLAQAWSQQVTRAQTASRRARRKKAKA
jgi:hypothetical protein